jgi:hypothetical protein
MKRKMVILTICLSIVSIAAFVLAANSSESLSAKAQQSSKIKIQEKNPPPPQRVVYRFLFLHVLNLKQRAEDLKTQGKDSKGIENYYKNEAKLTDSEARALDEVAADSIREVGEIDSQAKAIIEAARAKFPDGRIVRGQELPPPPELEQLQDLRDAVLTRAHERLRTLFGEQRFREFDSFVQNTVGSQTRPISPKLRRPGVTPGDGKRRS